MTTSHYGPSCPVGQSLCPAFICLSQLLVCPRSGSEGSEASERGTSWMNEMCCRLAGLIRKAYSPFGWSVSKYSQRRKTGKEPSPCVIGLQRGRGFWGLKRIQTMLGGINWVHFLSCCFSSFFVCRLQKFEFYKKFDSPIVLFIVSWECCHRRCYPGRRRGNRERLARPQGEETEGWLDQVMNDQSKTAIGWRIVVLVSRKKKRKKHYLVTEEEAGLALEVLLI